MEPIAALASHEIISLHWAMHTSFADYVLTLPDGRRVTAEGATCTEQGQVVFPRAQMGSQSDPASPGALFPFRGEVEFIGHHGMLRLLIADPDLRVSGDGTAVLSVRGDEAADSRVDMVTLANPALTTAASDSPGTWLTFADVRLTADGTDFFFDRYRAGTPFAQVSIELGAPTT